MESSECGEVTPAPVEDELGVWWWTEDQAARSSASQLGASACGPTALLDVLRLLLGRGHVRSPAPEQVMSACPSRTRDYQAPLLQYPESRAKV